MSNIRVCLEDRVVSDDKSAVTGGSGVLAIPADTTTLTDVLLWSSTSPGSEEQWSLCER